MKKMIKVLSFTLALALLFSACFAENKVDDPNAGTADQVADNTKTATTSPTGEGTTVTYPFEGETVTLTYWTSLHPNAASYISSYAENEAWQKVMKDTNVNIEFEHPAAGQEKTTLSLLISSGDMPDIIQYGSFSSTYSGGMEAAINEGVIVDLTKYLPDYAPDYWPLVKNNILFQTPDGRYAAFYKVIDPEKADSNWRKMVTRKDFLTEAGIKGPDTLAELEAYFQWVIDNKKDVVPFTLPIASSSCWPLLTGIFDVIDNWYVDLDGKVQWGRAAGENYLEYLTTMRKWYEKGYISKDWTTMVEADYKAAYASGKIAMILGSGADLRTLAASAGFEAQTLPYIKRDENSMYHADIITSPNQGDSTVITTSCKNVEVAVKFLNYAYTKEGYMTYNYGVEGLSWNYDAKGNPVYTDHMLKPEEFGTENANYIYRIHFAPKYLIADRLSHPSLLSDPESLEFKAQWDNDPKVDSVLRLPVGVQLTSDESAKRSSIMTDISTYAMEMQARYINGEIPLSTYESEYLATIKSMKFEEAREITQAAYDRYMANASKK